MLIDFVGFLRKTNCPRETPPFWLYHTGAIAKRIWRGAQLTPTVSFEHQIMPLTKKEKEKQKYNQTKSKNSIALPLA